MFLCMKLCETHSFLTPAQQGACKEVFQVVTLYTLLPTTILSLHSSNSGITLGCSNQLPFSLIYPLDPEECAHTRNMAHLNSPNNCTEHISIHVSLGPKLTRIHDKQELAQALLPALAGQIKSLPSRRSHSSGG